MSDADLHEARTLAPSDRPGLALAALATEEPALEDGDHLLARERLDVGLAPVTLEHREIVLQRLVGVQERLLELVPLEDDVLGAGLVGWTELRD